MNFDKYIYTYKPLPKSPHRIFLSPPKFPNVPYISQPPCCILLLTQPQVPGKSRFAFYSYR